ncbi:hypothetical protein CC1G_14416 [Coprinopsis cinerea okayama7|uniref:Uncharacterized protein n=1 Tax=Coprinopsis cinerea (strain Okayama-7 / 130 / ATCC MYA-4618 / FGSC 9003) TaxID=240176 RepID=D6RM27_COPC7|nr:hypothetical protein CC1G_14416 [Coprinopsis cinerea okayama7\|eukprot:XP_002911419.1 hypothetical protein CC1G_14416 [Coprinopsis cinerea okayama7\
MNYLCQWTAETRTILGVIFTLGPNVKIAIRETSVNPEPRRENGCSSARCNPGRNIVGYSTEAMDGEVPNPCDGYNNAASSPSAAYSSDEKRSQTSAAPTAHPVCDRVHTYRAEIRDQFIRCTPDVVRGPQSAY